MLTHGPSRLKWAIRMQVWGRVKRMSGMTHSWRQLVMVVLRWVLLMTGSHWLPMEIIAMSGRVRGRGEGAAVVGVEGGVVVDRRRRGSDRPTTCACDERGRWNTWTSFIVCFIKLRAPVISWGIWTVNRLVVGVARVASRQSRGGRTEGAMLLPR